MRKKKLPAFVIGGIITAGVLILFSMPAVLLLVPRVEVSPTIALANIVVLPAPTRTSTPMAEEQTPTLQGTANDGISVGQYVQVVGTEGEGLRIRSGPSLASDVLFVAMDAEAFRVSDGPRQSDGRTWWYLTAPYDQSRSGWAVGDYLVPIPSQSQ
jgi:hypothetical protein